MKNFLAKLSGVRLPRLTPAGLYNVSVIAGISAASAGAGQAFGHPAALMLGGALVLAFAVFERLLSARVVR